MLVLITPKEVKGLADCSEFIFETALTINKGDWSLGEGPDQDEQKNLLTAISVLLGRFKNYPCEVNLEVGTNNGKGFMKGNVSPWHKEAVAPVQQILTESYLALCVFTRSYPQSKFSLIITQKVTIPEIRYELPLSFFFPFVQGIT